MSILWTHQDVCVIKILPVFPVHDIPLFCVSPSGCVVLVVPNKTLCIFNGNRKVSKHVFVWITCT